jgi:hypothetical protein
MGQISKLIYKHRTRQGSARYGIFKSECDLQSFSLLIIAVYFSTLNIQVLLLNNLENMMHIQLILNLCMYMAMLKYSITCNDFFSFTPCTKRGWAILCVCVCRVAFIRK